MNGMAMASLPWEPQYVADLGLIDGRGEAFGS
jgi:hypothetical protein